MKVGHRINARKVVLSYFYQRCFFHNLGEQDNTIENILSVDNVFSSNKELFDKEKNKLLSTINGELKKLDDENLEYFINIFFDKRSKDNIDLDYVFKVGKSFEKYFKDTIKNVDQFKQSFAFSEMNSMNQALFILGYVEWKVLETPKEILLNELIELSKRYDDEGSPKLINGIMHKVFNNIQE